MRKSSGQLGKGLFSILNTNLKETPPGKNLQKAMSQTGAKFMRVTISQNMQPNIEFAKQLNPDKRKLHFEAAKSVGLQVPGSLNKDLLAQRSKQQTSFPRFSSQGSFMDVPHGSKGFHTSTSSSFLLSPLKSHKMGQTHSNFQTPKTLNPLIVSKEKQKEMSATLQRKAQNPYELKQRKESQHSPEDREKIEVLLSTQQQDSALYNYFSKNPHHKKLRFGMQGAASMTIGEESNKDESLTFSEHEVKPILKQGKAGDLGKAGDPIPGYEHVDSQANDVLRLCNVVPEKKRWGPAHLRKGEGRNIGGGGSTNLEIYDKLRRTL